MKKTKTKFLHVIIIISVILACIIFVHQRKTNEAIPNQTVVIGVTLPTGYSYIIIKKGLLNKNNEDKKWITLEKFERSQIIIPLQKINNKMIFEVN